MASLGTFLLLAAFVVCSYAVVASVVGARRGSRRLVESGIGAFYLIAALMTVATAVIINAFLTDDFTIKYVSRYSDSVQPLFYKITSYWGGLDGSIMFWVFLLSIFGLRLPSTVTASRHRELTRTWSPPSPRSGIFRVPDDRAQKPVRHLRVVRAARRRGAEPGPSELGWSSTRRRFTRVCRHERFRSHSGSRRDPGHLDDSRLRAYAAGRCSSGSSVGRLSRHDLGVRRDRMGGYGAGITVENAALLRVHRPAFLHSVSAGAAFHAASLERSSGHLTFFLTIFGRPDGSGVVQSCTVRPGPDAHRDVFEFMVALLTFSFGLVITVCRCSARARLDSWRSARSGVLVNNWISCCSARFSCSSRRCFRR